ncbi:MAG: NADH-quinone oxidoreductase subunit J [Rikenellaceae bacterium]|jgi:NADH-quinone oxidoreductase subunit J|nr:NADH-quinone oxidoreductase subunit J [Rikenellaceae bacterium]
MGTSANLILFWTLAAVIVGSSVLAVTARRMMRAATWLLFVLIGTAGLYLLLNYHFLAAVQLSVYAGGVLVLFIFAIMLTSANGDRTEPQDKRRIAPALLTSLAGAGVAVVAVMKQRFLYGAPVEGDTEINMKAIGTALMGSGKYQYLLPFEALGILLLICAVAAILIARKK